jgi:enolase-phosphatase E1
MLRIGANIRAILLDVEGTTTPVSFVYDVLFPYARAHLRAYLQAHQGTQEIRDIASTLAEQWAAERGRGEAVPEWPDGTPIDRIAPLERYAEWLMDRDRKSPGLKWLQGRIWQEGFRAGELRGQLFSDVAPALGRWTMQRLDVAIYSSGSVLSQRLLFGANNDRDVTPLITAYFDTAVGPKTSPDSYRRIADLLHRLPAEILFVSDVSAELEAARAAGLSVALSVRPGNSPQTIDASVPRVASFAEIEVSSFAERLQASRMGPFVLLWVVLAVGTSFAGGYPWARSARWWADLVLWLAWYWVPPRPRLDFVMFTVVSVGLWYVVWPGDSALWLGGLMPLPWLFGVVSFTGAVVMFAIARPKFRSFDAKPWRGWAVAAAIGLAAGVFMWLLK